MKIVVEKSKKIGRYLIEIKTYPMAGGTINIWEKGESRLPHIWENSPDKTMHKADEVNFMYAQNALDEYRALKTVKDIINLMYRNM